MVLVALRLSAGAGRDGAGLVLAAMQVGNIVASLWASLDRDNFGWLALGGMPAAAILLLIFLLRKVETHQVTGVEGTGPE